MSIRDLYTNYRNYLLAYLLTYLDSLLSCSIHGFVAVQDISRCTYRTSLQFWVTLFIYDDDDDDDDEVAYFNVR